MEELRKAPIEELKEKSFNLRKELFTLRTKQKLGQLKNSASLELLRRDIAKVETILSEHQKSKRMK
ncbi:MAG: 50S ribosomal protein L29 [Candidatus Omnitrophica bacterium]|nr:50S ribosomal protein L29 [Candidatus Omnitrophota bacterium]